MMHMYAIVEINGKQYRAEQGKDLIVDRFCAAPGESLAFENVVLLGGEKVEVGAPYVAGAAVKATVNKEFKADKVVVFKYMPKKGYRRTRGHRQPYTALTVNEIVGA
jgi:large subunit ribosomal protein L21